MRAVRLAKALARGVRISWREVPTQHDIAALDANIQRVGLVIRLRWILVLVLSLFSVAGAGLYTRAIPLEELVRNLLVPGFALLFVVAYNTMYQLTYRRLGNIRLLNHAQLMFDVLVAGVLIHYSGGVNSWFYAMLLLFILEGAFILPETRDVWILAGFAAVVYSVILLGHYAGFIPLVPVPFAAGELETNGVYVGVRVLWVVTILAGAAYVSSYLMAEVRGRERRLEASSSLDERTGLTNRAHFTETLAKELNRARRNGTALAVFLVDIDEFGRFNRSFGLDAGNRMLEAVAKVLTDVVSKTPDADPELVTVSRWGGEEFAVVVPGGADDSADLEAFEARVRGLGERFREAAKSVAVDDMTITVSVGVAVFPADASSEDDLMAAADEAVARSLAAGGDAVTCASECGGAPVP